MNRLRYWLDVFLAFCHLPGDLLRAWGFLRAGKPVPPLWDRAVPTKHRYVYFGHSGRRARMRAIRRSWAKVEALPGEAAQRARTRLWTVALRKPDPKLAVMLMAHAALVTADETGMEWPQVMELVLSGMEANAA